MRWLYALWLVAVTVILVAPGAALACPSCKEAVAASGDSAAEEEAEAAANSSSAYNNSIYLMVSVPYLALAVGIFLIYRGLRKNAEYLRAIGKPAEGGAPAVAPTGPPA